MSHRFFVASRKGLFTVERSAEVAKPWAITATAFLGDNVSMVLPDPRDGCVYAALEHGHFGVKLHRSINGGKDWEECATPTYPEKPTGFKDRDTWGKEIPWNTVRIWSLETGGAAETGHLWCGTIPGGLFHSQDRGTSWSLVRSLWDHPARQHWFGGGADLPGIHSICVDPRDPRCVHVAVSCGGVWLSKDAGETWEPRAQGMRASYMPPERQNDPDVQDPHRLVQCATQPDCLWTQHHDGIFRSRDGGKSWQEIPKSAPSTFGFAVAVHPQDPDTAWFLPAESDQRRMASAGQIVVTRTRDGGKNFEVLREGLPQTHAYDLVYRHGLDIDLSGERLCFGTTTGSVWISEDQGDRWQCVSNHLPPVYCVRFVNV
jgi:hypothetical protein